ncbi:MAG TPA: CoA transferase [Pseudonocardia sp.]|nr:CoA transferase [Pseudonocardia sp.]
MTPVPEGPFAGVRVLELTSAGAGRTAGMLLADLGADVARIPPGGRVPTGWTPEDLCLDRGKRLVTGRDAGSEGELRRLALAADVVLDDATPGTSVPGLEPAGLLAARPSLVHVALPPHGTRGRWLDLPADPLLLGALGGFATHHPAHEPGRPVASVVPLVGAVQGALAAVAAAAGLMGVRTSGHGRALEVSGLHASAACLGTMMVEGMDVERVFSPGSRLPGSPNFRTYRCADGRFLHLAALTADFFFRALDVLDRMDVLVLPEVDGEFANLLKPDVGAAVGEELEPTLATRPRDEWLAAFAEAEVPAAPVRTRAEWLDDEIVASAAPPVTLTHPVLGRVAVPGVPIGLPATPGAVRHLPGPGHVVGAGDLWREPAAARVPEGSAPDLPLTGLRVVDLSTFLAAPFASAVLADLGAAVVKVETTGGDPYRVFSASYASANHAKTIASLDLRTPAGRGALLELAGGADVLVDNLRPASMARLGLGDEVLGAAGPALVRCSVSAYGRTGPFADLPGFDPVLQALSGLSAAQGGTGEPVATTAPVHDVATGALAALGVLAALVARTGSGRGQHVTVSLAATSTFLQAPELTGYDGRPPAAVGGRDFAGPSVARGYHRVADGWVAIAAVDAAQERAVAVLLGPDPAATLGGRPVEHWLAELARLGVPACPVVAREGVLHAPHLVANDFSHVVRDPALGRLRLVRGYIGAVHPAAGAGPAVRPGWDRAVALLGAAGTLHEPFATVAEEAPVR